MRNRTIMFGLLLAVVAGSGALAEPARALQGAGSAVAGPDQTAHQTVSSPAHEGAQATGGFEKGKTTLHEVEHAIGEPNTSTVDAGKTTACYQYAGTPTAPESFVRVVGAASPGETALTCCFSFTSSGSLEGVAASINPSSVLALSAEKDAKAGRKIACPPKMLEVKPDTVMDFDSSGSR